MANAVCSSQDGEKRVEFERVGGFFLNGTADSARQNISPHSTEKRKR